GHLARGRPGMKIHTLHALSSVLRLLYHDPTTTVLDLTQMRSLGRILREAREKLGLSLDELVQQTRISRKSLEALEADNPAGVGGPFYFRSFAKQIARALALDTPEWQEALARATAVSA